MRRYAINASSASRSKGSCCSPPARRQLKGTTMKKTTERKIVSRRLDERIQQTQYSDATRASLLARLHPFRIRDEQSVRKDDVAVEVRGRAQRRIVFHDAVSRA